MNSKKIISSVSLATAVLATGIISQEEVHADSVDNTTTTTASQAQPQLVTAEQFASAKATFENNQEAQAQAQSAADSKKQTFGVCFLDT
ncbi:hypothetical protein GPW67_01820 [Streptococcus thermophilus]|nr:hypothetical protein [Streptococcus thermophilus]MCE2204984.1 hypothetical protein [Streptococcus thermophilus]MCE2206813.1 hypothetical protein [Streptococcus thermophilus]MCE2211250.1 hypothetical protein [Streptococcus thermophilus]MCE2215972.1 hypothetical protein [Streptococcus thermophilus]